MRLFVGARTYLLHQTISSLEQRLNPAQFVRLHRSHIVRRDHIDGLRHDGRGIWFARLRDGGEVRIRSEEHTSELQSLMRISYAVFCLKKNKITHHYTYNTTTKPQ